MVCVLYIFFFQAEDGILVFHVTGVQTCGLPILARYKVFNDAIKDQYPDIVIVSGSGPFPDGGYFEYGMEQLTQIGAEIIDEHYYKSPEWFRSEERRVGKEGKPQEVPQNRRETES